MQCSTVCRVAGCLSLIRRLDGRATIQCQMGGKKGVFATEPVSANQVTDPKKKEQKEICTRESQGSFSDQGEKRGHYRSSKLDLKIIERKELRLGNTRKETGRYSITALPLHLSLHLSLLFVFCFLLFTLCCDASLVLVLILVRGVVRCGMVSVQ